MAFSVRIYLKGFRRPWRAFRVPWGADARQPFLLIRLVSVDADDDGTAVLDGLLRAISGLLDFSLNESRLNGREGGAGFINPSNEFHRLLLKFVRQLLDRICATHGVDGVGDAGFERDNLLRAERQPSGILGWQR